MRPQINVPQYDIHPISIKMINRGHPWITKDKFSEKFNPRDRFIVALNRKRPFGLFLHDPTHKFISARLWSKEGNFAKLVQNFKKDLANRVATSIKKRSSDQDHKDRQNIYLVFGEADKLPGLFIQMLGTQILIQFYSNFWDHYQDIIVKELIDKMSEFFDINITRSNIWVQKRGQGSSSQTPAKCLDPNIAELKFTISEYDVNYKLILGRYYDFGIYTDMAAIRKKLQPSMQNAKKVLNLFSYTGAYSLFALKHNSEVTSVDLSQSYLEWLEENIKLNPQLEPKAHTTVQDSVANFLKNCDQKYNLIISDPPSSSSDGKKRTSALKDYEKTLLQMYNLLDDEGELVLFLNTHNIGMNKFQQKMTQIIEQNNLKLKVLFNLGTHGDCPQLKGFPEGSYLKGIVLKKYD